MSIEEKAKAYDEVLEKVKGDYIAYKKVGDIAGMDAITSIFPQIAESEDERIRKAVVELVKWVKAQQIHTDHFNDDIKWDDMLAYLEKQKEAQPGDEYRYMEGYMNGMNDALKKQKPAEWGEDYREEDIQTRFAFYTYKDDSSTLYLSNVFVEEASRNHGFGTRILKAAEKVAEAIGAITISLKVKQDSPANAWYRKNGYGYVCFEDGYDWLEKNLEYLKPQKSVTEWSDEEIKKIRSEEYTKGFNDAAFGGKLKEWSEEDEDKMRQIERIAQAAGCTQKLQEEIHDWLKFLPKRFNLQPEMVWSDEDKKRIQRICDFLWKNRKGDTDTIYQIEKDADWLKSLPPQPHTISIRNANKFAELEYERGVKDGLNHNWKPTEEQINYLAKAILTLSEEGDNKTSNILNELRTQLKQL